MFDSRKTRLKKIRFFYIKCKSKITYTNFQWTILPNLTIHISSFKNVRRKSFKVKRKLCNKKENTTLLTHLSKII